MTNCSSELVGEALHIQTNKENANNQRLDFSCLLQIHSPKKVFLELNFCKTWDLKNKHLCRHLIWTINTCQCVMIKWRLEMCEWRFLCMSGWRCRSASHQISCICLHLPAAVSPVSDWNGAALLQQPNAEPLVLSGCLSFLFFSYPLLSLVPLFHLSAALSSSCILPAVASLYKCLPPFVAGCLTCHCDIWQIAQRTALSLRLPFWLMMFTPVIISYRAAVRGGTDTQACPATSYCGLTFFFYYYFFFFYAKNYAPCDTWLMAYWVYHYSPVLFCHSWEN